MVKSKRKVWFDVKNTIIKVLLEVLSPNRCQRCGLKGESLCGRCKKYLLGTNPGYVVTTATGFSRVIVGGVKEGILSSMLKEYKYHGRRDLAEVLAWKMWEVVRMEKVWGMTGTGKLSETARIGKVWETARIVHDGKEVDEDEVVLVPLPTIMKHIRERGFDHMMLLAREVCRLMDFEKVRVEPILVRLNKTVQVGKSAEVRLVQARRAYGLKNGAKINLNARYVLFDDVWTTGASMRAAAEVLRTVGVQKIESLVLMSNDYLENDDF